VPGRASGHKTFTPQTPKYNNNNIRLLEYDKLHIHNIYRKSIYIYIYIVILLLVSTLLTVIRQSELIDITACE